MVTREEIDVYELAEGIEEELTGRYSGEEFYEEAKKRFEEEGYFVRKGQERDLEAYNPAFDLESDHLEYAAKVLDFDEGRGPLSFSSVDVRFVLKNGVPGGEEPMILYGEDAELLDLPETKEKALKV